MIAMKILRRQLRRIVVILILWTGPIFLLILTYGITTTFGPFTSNIAPSEMWGRFEEKEVDGVTLGAEDGDLFFVIQEGVFRKATVLNTSDDYWLFEHVRSSQNATTESQGWRLASWSANVLGLSAVFGAFLSVHLTWILTLAYRRFHGGRCITCGYNLQKTESKRCSECGDFIIVQLSER